MVGQLIKLESTVEKSKKAEELISVSKAIISVLYLLNLRPL